MINFQEIMTRSVIFYDDEYEPECLDFAQSRNITLLPDIADIDMCHQYDIGKQTFKQKKIDPDQLVDVSDDIFQSHLVKIFRAYKVLFVSDQQQIVGVVHFSDYNRQAVYREIYNQLFLLEKGVKYILLNLSSIGRSEWLKFRGQKFLKSDDHKQITSEDLHEQGVSLPILLHFARENKLLKAKEHHIYMIKELRNRIAHSEAFIKKDKAGKAHNHQNYLSLSLQMQALRIILRQVNNRIFLMKATLDEDFKQSVMPLDEFLFYHE